MTGEEGKVDTGAAELVKIQRSSEAKGEFLKTRVCEIDEEEEKELNAPSFESIVHIKTDEETSDEGKGLKERKKGILKHNRTYSNKHVDFNLDIEVVPFDESKDYTIEIQIVEKMPKKIVSYAALIAQQKALEEEEKKKKEEKVKQPKTTETKPDCTKCKIKKIQKEKQENSTNKSNNTNEKIGSAELTASKNNNLPEMNSHISLVDEKTVDILQQHLILPSDINKKGEASELENTENSVEDGLSNEDSLEGSNCNHIKGGYKPQETTISELLIKNEELNIEKDADCCEDSNKTEISSSSRNSEERQERGIEFELQNTIKYEQNLYEQKEITTKEALENVRNPEEKKNEDHENSLIIKEQINKKEGSATHIIEGMRSKEEKHITDDKYKEDKKDESDITENSDQDDFFESFDDSESLGIKSSLHENSNISNSSSFSEEIQDDAACNIKSESLTETNATENDKISCTSLPEDPELTEDPNEGEYLSVNSNEEIENIPRSISPIKHDLEEKITQEIENSTAKMSTSDILSPSLQSITVIDLASSVSKLEKENEIKCQSEINEFEKGDFCIQKELESSSNCNKIKDEDTICKNNGENFSEPIAVVGIVESEIEKDVVTHINTTKVEGKIENCEIKDNR